MKNKQTLQLTKDELQKQLKRKSASLERMKRKMKISEEVHSREAQIEAALEKVRSCSLAMHKSDELRDVVKVVFEKLQELDFAIDGAAFIGTLIENSQDINIWIGDKHAEYPSCFRTPVYDAPSVMDILKAKESGADFFSKTYSFEEKNKWFEYAFQHTDYKTLPDQLKNWVLEQPFLTQSFAWAENSGVGIHFHHKITLSENEIDILKRFSKVFEQGYVRFLDLQKAEAQAREAMIEAALEKIRSRSLAMQKSDELKDVIAVVFEKLKELGLVFDGAGIQLFRHGSRDSVLWVSSEISEPSLINLPYIEKANENSEFINTLWTARKTGKDIYNRTYSFDEKNKYFNYVISNNPQIPASIRELMFQSPSYTLTMIMKKNSALIADSFSGKALSLEEYNILGRVASVFEQVYVRFLDLQKAEAQAREAQIELALERVRAKTMAMQKSDELKEVIQLVYDQFVHLNIYIEHTGFLMDYKERDDLHIWLADRHLIPSEVTIPWFDSLPNNSIKEAKEKGQDFFKYLLDFEEKNKFYQDLFMFIPGVPEETLKYYFNCPGLAGSGVLLENIGLYIENFSGTPYTDEENDTLMRLGKVFQQTYTRFLDLEKAEAQARESQIQLALERVRARTMAMQKSDELSETVYVLFQQFKELGENPDQATIGVINEDEKLIEYWVTMYGKPINKVFKFSIDEPNVTNKIYKAWKENKKSLMIDLSGDALTEFMAYRAEKGGAAINRDEKRRVINVAFFSKGLLNVQSNEERSEESIKLLERFASVFEQTYTRFLDLQKAEAQAREAKIEAALERVRSRSLAMHTSNELEDVIMVVSGQLQSLNFRFHNVSFARYNEINGLDFWLSSSGQPTPYLIHVPYLDNPMFNGPLEAIKKGIDFVADVITPKDNHEWIKHLLEKSILKKISEKDSDFLLNTEGYARSLVITKNIILVVGNYASVPYSDEQNSILKRFANVFDQAYTRFLDLQKAEAQTRESQIQLALERVRARTMAMQKSDELSDAVYILFQQFRELGENPDQATIGIIDEVEKVIEYWVTMYGKPINKVFKFSTDEPNVTNKIYKAWKENKKSLMIDLTGDALTEFMTYRAGKGGAAINPKEKRRIINVAFFSKGLLNVQSNEERSEESIKLLERFASVFEQTYTRFLDLQKAEAQAREAQIEAALEKVRSRSLAMHHSSELEQVAGSLFDRLVDLGLWFDGALIFIFDKEKRSITLWIATVQLSAPVRIDLPYDKVIENNAIIKDLWNAIRTGSHIIERSYSGEVKNDYFRYVAKYNGSKIPEPVKQLQLDRENWTLHLAAEKNSLIGFDSWSGHITKEEDFKILIRFGKVFEQSYIRFLDLQKAEAQAREAQIEAALERVRARTMAMQISDELLPTAEIMFGQLKQLGAELQGVAFAICDKNSMMVQKWTSIGNFSHPYNIEPGEQRMFEAWKNQSGMYEEVYEGEKQKKYYELFMEIPEFRKGLQKVIDLGIPIPTWQKNYAVPFNNGYVLFIITKPFDETQIFLRFGKVFEQTYTRFLDLQKAEAAAREAIKQASLDRIRADIASMRTTKDLERITPLIWNELNILGIPFIRCGVFIMDDEQQIIHTFLSTPDGKAIAAFQIPYDTPGNIKHVINYWHNNKNYIDHWDENAFTEFANTLVEQGAHISSKQYLQTIPHGGFYLHFLPFLQGMLYVGNTIQLHEDEINLIQSLAGAFSTAYARYEDFNKLEAAKKQVDITLNELQAAQKQLIQSEKMASLGELTAGIAHEIQNPLNFVNNFSDVNTELIDEAGQEIDKGNISEAKSILSDIKENEEKINHHGKRAGDIVKGMLQHSRSSTGVKEPTDINALADEYLRLSYHGLRAKDKSFNAKMETNFDNSIGKINIIPQDIGRVLLNLFNNAFYAVNQQISKNLISYEPTVSVTTKKSDNHVIITVSDNGGGIPQNIVDKIFQPFFTTKPTGSGTGLGLSLSYDIVKAHGGEIKVETKKDEARPDDPVGRGSEFIIQLPV